MTGKNLTILVLLIGSILGLKAQHQEVFVSIENHQISNDTLVFDIFIYRAVHEPDIYLGHSDFVFLFDTLSFHNPSVSRIGVDTGFCTLTPTNTDFPNPLLTRIAYFDGSHISLIDNQLVINLLGPSPGDQSAFDSRVARIDQNTQMHRLGRFAITGLKHPKASSGLKWKPPGSSGLITRVTGLENSGSFSSVLYDATTIDASSCLDLLDLGGQGLPAATYQAEATINSANQIMGGGSCQFKAGQSIELEPGFSVPAATTFEIKIEGCNP